MRNRGSAADLRPAPELLRRVWQCGRCAARPAVTLVELLVVIVIVGMLMAILIPAMNGARESARQHTCSNNLRQLGIGMHQYAARQRGQLCSGAFDWLADGCVTEIGWVADQVAQGTEVGKMLCPSNPAQLGVTFSDLVSGTTTTDNCVNKRGSQPNNPCAKILDGSGDRASIVQSEILGKGYNTNYTASWYLVRSGVLLVPDPADPARQKLKFAAFPGTCPKSVTSRNSTLGPLNLNFTDSWGATLEAIPLLGCGATAAGMSAPGIASNSGRTNLAVSFTGGPIKLADASEVKDTDPSQPRSWWNQNTLQDYRGFGPVHRGVCNVLFADGHVDGLVDGGDGLINNGFPANVGGFTSSTPDVDSSQLYSNWSLSAR